MEAGACCHHDEEGGWLKLKPTLSIYYTSSEENIGIHLQQGKYVIHHHVYIREVSNFSFLECCHIVKCTV